MLVEPPEVTNGPPTPETFHIHKLCRKKKKTKQNRKGPIHCVFKLFRDKVPYFTQYYRNYEHSLGCGNKVVKPR